MLADEIAISKPKHMIGLKFVVLCIIAYQF